MRYIRKDLKVKRTLIFLGFLILSTVVLSTFPPSQASTAVTVPFSSTPVNDIDLDGLPGTGAWGDAAVYSIPLENGQPAPYGTATLRIKHNGTNIYYRINGTIDVAWISATGNHFWLAMQVSQTGTTHHGSGTWDGVFFGLWDGTDYAPAPTNPPTAVDTNGFARPPTKDVTQNAVGTMRNATSGPNWVFTAEWKKALNTGDASDIVFVADGVTTYNFFVTTDSNGRGSSGGGIDHSVVTNLNTLKLAAPPPTVHDVAVVNVLPFKNVVGQGYSMKINVTVENQGNIAETFNTTLNPPGNPVSLMLTGRAGSGWNSSTPGPTITANRYDDVRLTLVSGDGITHTFYVDYNGNGSPSPGEPMSSSFTATIEFEFMANTLGSFTYYCSFHQATMFGTFNVNPPTAIQIGTQQASLNPGQQQTLTFAWNTTGVSFGNVTISATAATVPGETDTADNVLTDGNILVTIPGDTNGDHKVDVLDLFGLGKAYGSVPGNPNWNLYADIDNNGNVNIVDLGIARDKWGQQW